MNRVFVTKHGRTLMLHTVTPSPAEAGFKMYAYARNVFPEKRTIDFLVLDHFMKKQKICVVTAELSGIKELKSAKTKKVAKTNAGTPTV